MKLTKERCDECIFAWGASVAVDFDRLKPDKARAMHPDEADLIADQLKKAAQQARKGQGDE